MVTSLPSLLWVVTTLLPSNSDNVFLFWEIIIEIEIEIARRESLHIHNKTRYNHKKKRCAVFCF